MGEQKEKAVTWQARSRRRSGGKAMTEKKYEQLKDKLVAVIKEFAANEGGITFGDLESLVGLGEVYYALKSETFKFVSGQAEKTSGQ